MNLAAHTEAGLRELLRTPSGQAARVLVVDTLGWRPHLETSMEIALNARDEGHDVTYLNLRAALPRVEDQTWFPRSLDVNAVRCRRGVALLRNLGMPVAAAGITPAQAATARRRARDMLMPCRDRQSVRSLSIEGFADLGWATLSSAVSITRDPLTLPDTHPALFRDLLASAQLAFEATLRAIQQHRPDVVVLFNGRFATARAVFRAAAHAGVRPLIHERGRDRGHYWVATDAIHDPDYLQACMREFWTPERVDDGHRFFRARRERVESNWFSYVRGQQQGKLPPGIGAAGKWVVFFTTSEDECVAISEKYQNELFPTQLDAINAVHAAVRESPEYRLCIRLHPHIAAKSRQQVRFWRQFSLPDTLVVAPEADVDSYALMERADVVCTYGSTVGVEATYWKRPSLLLNRSAYDRLGVARSVTTPADIIEFLKQPTVFPQSAALPYGAFFAGFGLPFRRFAATDLFRGEFMDTVLDDAFPVRVWRRLKAGASRLLGSRGAT